MTKDDSSIIQLERRERDPINLKELIHIWRIGTTSEVIESDIRALLQRFQAEEEHKLEEAKKHGTLFSDYTLKECEIYMYAYVMSRIDDLGRGIIVDTKPKGDPKKSGQSGRHMGTGTDELCIEK